MYSTVPWITGTKETLKRFLSRKYENTHGLVEFSDGFMDSLELEIHGLIVIGVQQSET